MERMTALSKAILLSEIQIPCMPYIQAPSPVPLDLSAVRKNMKGVFPDA